MDVYTVEDVMRILCCKKSYAYKKIREARHYFLPGKSLKLILTNEFIKRRV